MVDVGIKDNLKTYFNGTLAGTPNQVYDEIVNWDIVKPRHRHRTSSNSFMLRKRKGFKQGFAAINGVITDIQDMQDQGEVWRFYYSITDTDYYVYKRKLSDCEAPALVDSGDRRENMFDKFVRTDFVKGPKREINTASAFEHTADLIDDGGSYPQAIGNVAGNTYNWGGGSNAIENADYVRVYNASGTTVMSQVRRIIGRVASGYNSRDTLIVDSPFTIVSGPTDSGAVYSIFPDWGDVLVYAGIDSGYMGASDLNCAKIIHSPYSIDAAGAMNETTTITTLFITIDQYGSRQRCISHMVEHNQLVLVHYDNGYTAFGSTPTGVSNGYYKFYHTVDEQIFWGTDITELVSFRNFVIGFGSDTIKAATLFEGTSYLQGQISNLRDNLGIGNEGAHAQFDNSMRFVASNKRLYSVNINTDGDKYILDLQDQSQPIIGYLDQIQEGDEIYMDVNENEMVIYHINQTSGQYDGGVSDLTDAANNWKTRIIKFNKDYTLVHIWETSKYIKGRYKSEYMSDGTIFHNCGTVDGTTYYEAKIGAFIGDSEPSPTETNIFEKKSINWGKVVLGDGIYDNSYTYFKIFCYENGNKTVRYVGGLGENPYLGEWSTWASTGDTSGTFDCWSGDGEEVLYEGEVGGRDRDRTVDDDRCGPSTYGCSTYIEENSGGERIQSPIDKLSGFVVVPVPVATNPSDVIRIEFVSRGGDIATFGGMFFEVQKLPFDQIEGYGDNVLLDSTCSRAYSGLDLA